MVDALNASVDLILISFDTQQIFPALWALAQAEQSGALDQQLLNKSARRLDRFRP